MQTGATILIPRFAAIAIALCLTISAALGDQSRLLRSPDGGEVRGLIVGIDAYRNVRALKGAVADAQDIEEARGGRELRMSPR